MPRIEPFMKTTVFEKLFTFVVRLARAYGIAGILVIPLRPDTRT
jgi:hypothetical protein